MKVRNGYVSNSSSSSFILFGFTIKEKKDYKELCKKYLDNDVIIRIEASIDDINDMDSWKDAWWDYSDEIKGGFGSIYCDSNEERYVGKVIAYDDELFEENNSITFDELKEYEEKINKLFPGEKCNLHYGSVVS